MKNKEKYHAFCETEKLPLFYQPWWLDLVCGAEKWDVALHEKNNKVYGVFPYYIKRKKFITMPPLTPYLGPIVLFPKEMNYHNRMKLEKDALSQMTEKLPNFYYFSIQLPISTFNWLPFYWKNFHQTTHYTYLLDLQKDINSVFDNQKNNLQRNIKNAQKYLQVVDGKGYTDTFYQFLTKNLNIRYSKILLQQVIDRCYEKGQGKVLIVKDEEGQVYCGGFFVWDEYYTYYLLGARNPQIKDSRAMSLLLWEAVKMAKAMSRYFDFEGSMIEPVERFFRFFGAERVPYLHIYKYNSFILRSFIGLTGIFKRKHF
jgi:hypothetical protein